MRISRVIDPQKVRSGQYGASWRGSPLSVAPPPSDANRSEKSEWKAVCAARKGMFYNERERGRAHGVRGEKMDINATVVPIAHGRIIRTRARDELSHTRKGPLLHLLRQGSNNHSFIRKKKLEACAEGYACFIYLFFHFVFFRFLAVNPFFSKIY